MTQISDSFSTPPRSPTRRVSPKSVEQPPMSFSNPNYNPFVDAGNPFNCYNPRDVPVPTAPNTTVHIIHREDTSEPDNILFHDTSMTHTNFIPASSNNTTIVNIHPAPRVTHTVDNSFLPLLNSTFTNDA